MVRAKQSSSNQILCNLILSFKMSEWFLKIIIYSERADGNLMETFRNYILILFALNNFNFIRCPGCGNVWIWNSFLRTVCITNVAVWHRYACKLNCQTCSIMSACSIPVSYKQYSAWWNYSYLWIHHSNELRAHNLYALRRVLCTPPIISLHNFEALQAC
jgi:hypothetical protein